jgi:hypothetical protein
MYDHHGIRRENDTSDSDTFYESDSSTSSEGSFKSYKQQLKNIECTVESYLYLKSPTKLETSAFIENIKDMSSAVEGKRSIVGRCLIAQLTSFVAGIEGRDKMARSFLHFWNLYTPLESLQADLTKTEKDIIESFFVEQRCIEDMVKRVDSIKKSVGNVEHAIVERLASSLPGPEKYLEQIREHATYLLQVLKEGKIDPADHYATLKMAWTALSKITVDGS